MITPSGSSGGPQLSVIDVELIEEAENDVGGVLGPVHHENNTINVQIGNEYSRSNFLQYSYITHSPHQ